MSSPTLALTRATREAIERARADGADARVRCARAAGARGDDDDAAFDGGGISRRRRRRFSSFASSVGALDATRGDGLRVLHDPTASGDGGDDAADAALRRRRARFGFAAAADDGAFETSPRWPTAASAAATPRTAEEILETLRPLAAREARGAAKPPRDRRPRPRTR